MLPASRFQVPAFGFRPSDSTFGLPHGSSPDHSPCQRRACFPCSEAGSWKLEAGRWLLEALFMSWQKKARLAIAMFVIVFVAIVFIALRQRKTAPTAVADPVRKDKDCILENTTGGH